MFLNRQFWNCFKLFKNVLNWHGLLADKVLVDMAINSLLNRYLIIGLRVTLTHWPMGPKDSVAKSQQIINAIPSEWRKGKMRNELQRYIEFLNTLGTHAGLLKMRDAVKETANQLRSLSAHEDSEKLEKTVLMI